MDEQQKRQMIQQAFDTVSKGYDHPSLAFFPETAKRMMQHLQPHPDAKLLDVCTGTGVVAIAAARQLDRGEVVGIDLSAGMLEQASLKAQRLGLKNIEFVHRALEQLSYPNHHFDIITSSFGLFFMSDMKKSLAHMLEMLKPGGKIAISSFTDNAFSPMSDMFLKRYESFGKEAPALSWKRLSTATAVQDLFGSVGIERVTIHQEPLGHYMKQAQDWWDIVWNAGYRGLLNQLSSVDQALFEQQHREEVSELCKSEPAWLDTGVIIAVAEKP